MTGCSQVFLVPCVPYCTRAVQCCRYYALYLEVSPQTALSKTAIKPGVFPRLCFHEGF